MHVSRSNLSDQVVEEVQTLIRSKRFQVGDKLPVEDELAQMFHVSRTTIRAAMRKLSVMGILDVRQGSGTYVKSLTAAAFMRPLLPMLELDVKALSDIFEVRIMVECKAAELAAIHASQDQLDRLEILLNKMDNCVLQSDLDGYNELDTQFHYVIAEASANLVLKAIQGLLGDMVKDSIHASIIAPNALHISCIYHKKIYSAICNRDADAAKQNMLAHVQGGAEYVRNPRRGD